jgi:hypothetical protein
VPTAIAAVPSAAAAVYNYDSHHDATVWTSTTTERGPPEPYDRTTTYEVVDRWSHGALARPSLGTSPTAYTYDDPEPLVKIAQAAATTQRQARVTGRRVVAFELSGVAADNVLPTPQVSTTKLQNIVNNLFKGTTNPNRLGMRPRRTQFATSSRPAYRPVDACTPPKAKSLCERSITG